MLAIIEAPTVLPLADHITPFTDRQGLAENGAGRNADAWNVAIALSLNYLAFQSTSNDGPYPKIFGHRGRYLGYFGGPGRVSRHAVSSHLGETRTWELSAANLRFSRIHIVICTDNSAIYLPVAQPQRLEGKQSLITSKLPSHVTSASHKKKP